MEILTSLLIIFLFLIAGMVSAHFKLIPITGYLDTIMSVALTALLFSMGLRIGLLDSVTDKLLRIGLLSISIAAGTVIGTMLVVFIFLFLHGKVSPVRKNREKASGSILAGLAEPVRLLLFVLLGFICGLYVPVFSWFREEYTTYLLYALLYLIGVQMVRNEVDLRRAMLHPVTFLVPLGTIIGSLGGGLLAGHFFDLETGKALALAAGFGWYSLSGVLITGMGDPVLGAAAFLINVIRETIALLIIPFFARYNLAPLAIGVGGATTMDVTLPLIERSCGTEHVPRAIVNGAVLSMLVPFFVPFFYSLG